MRLLDKPPALRATANRDHIRALVRQCEAIPTVPSMLRAITRLTANVNCSLTALEAIIKLDPTCVAQLLQIANAAFYSSNGPVTSIRRTILMFGFNAVKNIADRLTVFDSFLTHNAAEMEIINRLRLHSLAVATLAQHIAGTIPRPVDADLAFCAGLLHDIGRFVLLHLFPAEYYRVLMYLEHDPEFDLNRAEVDLFEVTHAVVGRWLGEQWHFPPPYVQVIGMHHHTQAENALVATVMLANTLASQHNVGLSGGNSRAASLHPMLSALGIPPRRTDGYVAYLMAEAPDLEQCVMAGVANQVDTPPEADQGQAGTSAS